MFQHGLGNNTFSAGAGVGDIVQGNDCTIHVVQLLDEFFNHGDRVLTPSDVEFGGLCLEAVSVLVHLDSPSSCAQASPWRLHTVYHVLLGHATPSNKRATPATPLTLNMTNHPPPVCHKPGHTCLSHNHAHVSGHVNGHVNGKG